MAVQISIPSFLVTPCLRVVDGRTLYVNTTTETKSVSIKGKKMDVLSDRHYSGSILLEPYGMGLLQ